MPFLEFFSYIELGDLQTGTPMPGYVYSGMEYAILISGDRAEYAYSGTDYGCEKWKACFVKGIYFKTAEAYRMLHKLSSLRYSDLISIASAHDSGCVYPLSVAEGIQEGNIFTGSAGDYEKVLFWTQGGFAYLSGSVDECFLKDIYDFITDNKTDGKRFIIITKDKYIQEYFGSRKDVCIEKRYLFEYAGGRIVNEFILPAGYELKEIDNELWKKIPGTIVPSLFWKDVNGFLRNGKGYCIICGDDIAAWAFSAAVSTKEIDVGIETNSQYKRQGLGMIVAKKMIQYTIEQSKRPVWACHYKNSASEKMAEKLGVA